MISCTIQLSVINRRRQAVVPMELTKLRWF